MPYVFRDELLEGETEADVVSRDDYTTLETERDVLLLEKSEAVESAEKLKQELESAKTRFADAFLTTPQQVKTKQSNDIQDDGREQTFSALFAGRNKHAN